MWSGLKTLCREVEDVKDLVMLVRLAWLTIAVPLCLTFLRLPLLLELLTPRWANSYDKKSRGIDGRRAKRIAGWTNGVLSRDPFPYKNTCLKRSLIHYHMQRACGAEVVIHFGAKLESADLLGHAWLTLDGKPFPNPDEVITYPTIYSFPH
jgi:hypothetical protein